MRHVTLASLLAVLCACTNPQIPTATTGGATTGAGGSSAGSSPFTGGISSTGAAGATSATSTSTTGATNSGTSTTASTGFATTTTSSATSSTTGVTSATSTTGGSTGNANCAAPDTDSLPCSTLSVPSGACCGGSCVDITRDDQNCGSCYHACLGSTCQASACGAGSSTTASAGSTTGATTSGNASGSTSGATTSGTTTTGSTTGSVSCQNPWDCPGTQTCCSAVCVDTTLDNQNCGSCGSPCGVNTTCTNGTCLAATCSGETDGTGCARGSGAGTCCAQQCVDLGSDTSNCGTCGYRCDGTCQGGTCFVAACTNATNNRNCFTGGGAAGFCCDAVCTAGDATNCGACGIRCPVGASCTQWGCMALCPDSTCPSDSACDTAQAECVQTSCPANSDESACYQGGGLKTCCGGACIDESQDSANCGACGVSCGTGEACLGGQCDVTDCTGLPANTACYGQVNGSTKRGACCDDPAGGGLICTDTSDDPYNCGGCGVTCTSNEDCVKSHCVLTSCAGIPNNVSCEFPDAGSGTCCTSSCTDPSSDPNNCGNCGHVCSSGVCNGGYCL